MDVSPPTALYRWVASAVALVVFKSIVGKVLSIRAAFAGISDCPGRVSLWIGPFTPLAIALGPTFPRPGMGGYYAAKLWFYKKFGTTAYASVDLTTSQPVFWFADANALKIVTSDRHTFQKDISMYDIINIYGGNVVSLEGPDWKRHRSVAMSAFNEANIALVWSEALRVTNDWFEQLETTGSGVAVDLMPAMAQITLFIIGAAGFGKRVSWIADPMAEPPPGCQLTFRSALMDSVHNVIFRALIPNWFYTFSSLIKVPCLSSRALSARLAFDDLRIHMLDLVASARTEITSGDSRALGSALLRNLAEANMNQDGASKKLTEGELLSNIFIFLLAGHETATHTLCFALVLLALYPDHQNKIYEEVIRVWPPDVPAAQITTNHKECMDKLEYTAACIRETLRLFPVEPRISKEVYADTVLPGTYFRPGSKESHSVETGKFTVVAPVGSLIVIDIWALHMNSLYWGEDAADFKPERFIDTESYQWPRNAFLAFSGGARSCIGQRFALAEMTGIIASIVRRYQIRVPDDIAKKPWEEQKATLLKWTTGLSLTPSNARVKLCRRV